MTGALLWWALPLRPRLRGTLDVAPGPRCRWRWLITAALTPYAIDQIALQNAATSGYHSQNPHLFDMAWMVGVLMVLALVGALVREARGSFRWVAGVPGRLGHGRARLR